ncbi:MAG: DNA repair protein RadC [Synergistes sp.]|nr:DNA repair protein RadC [Synergistes sp.]
MDFSALTDNEKPREKLFKFGAASLTVAELIAILLRTGVKGEDVVMLSQKLLAKVGGLNGLVRMNTAELLQEKGLKEAKAATLAAALELGKRMVLLEKSERVEWKNVLNSLALETKFMERECIYALFLGASDIFLDKCVISYGGLEGAYFDVRLFFRQAVRLGAASVVLMHNHPDGSCDASREDRILTDYVENGLKYLGIALKEHFVAADGELYAICCNKDTKIRKIKNT